jgi:hypothetical protein
LPHAEQTNWLSISDSRTSSARSDGFICREGLSTHFPFAFG